MTRSALFFDSEILVPPSLSNKKHVELILSQPPFNCSYFIGPWGTEQLAQRTRVEGNQKSHPRVETFLCNARDTFYARQEQGSWLFHPQLRERGLLAPVPAPGRETTSSSQQAPEETSSSLNFYITAPPPFHAPSTVPKPP